MTESTTPLWEVFTYTLVNDPSGLFEIQGDQIVVKEGATIDFESMPSNYDITIQVTDSSGHTYSEAVNLSINDVNEDPTDIQLTGGTVSENAAAGSVVANLTTSDPDNGETFSYSIVNDPSGLFEIQDDQIVVKNGAVVDYEAAQSHDVLVQVTDSGGNTYSETFTLTINELNDGTNQADVIYGTNDADELYGLRGDDYIKGKAGDDKLFGGEDNDRVYGDHGDDVLDGGGGDEIPKCYLSHDVPNRCKQPPH